MAPATPKTAHLGHYKTLSANSKGSFWGVAELSVPADTKNASWVYVDAFVSVQGVFYIGIHFYLWREGVVRHYSLCNRWGF